MSQEVPQAKKPESPVEPPAAPPAPPATKSPRRAEDRGSRGVLDGWLVAARARRGVAAGVVVLATGGLVLARTPTASPISVTQATPEAQRAHVALGGGSNSTTFTGPGLHGRFALSESAVLAHGGQRLYAEIDLAADKGEGQVARAPLAIAIALDTSGSMSGEKIEGAKRACVQMIRDMRDDDEIAFVRYASDNELVQPLARVGSVREVLVSRVQHLSAGGGTDIPPALRRAEQALSDASSGRVRRVVLASDGLDSTRATAESYAASYARAGTTVSSMGIGLDFDEAYMGGVARAGRGNFGFVKDGASLASFLHRELEETATTTASNATVRLRLPEGVHLVKAYGTDAKEVGGGEVELGVGSLFAGDERRFIIELEARAAEGSSLPFEGKLTWSSVGGDAASASFSGVRLVGSNDPLTIEAGRDNAVLANATSVVASAREVEAAAAYSRGESARARALIDQNVQALAAAATVAPAAAPMLEAQARAYRGDLDAFAAPPSSEVGRAAAKGAAAKNMANDTRAAGF